MIILGIDPGTQRVGYGVIKKEAHVLTLVDAGILTVTKKDQVGALLEVRHEMERLVSRVHPDLAAVEKLYFAKNQKTALAVAQARGVIMVTIAEHHVPILEYAPNEIKARVTGDGGADKRAIAKMVALTLGVSPLNILDDATDAIAIALAAERDARMVK